MKSKLNFTSFPVNNKTEWIELYIISKLEPVFFFFSTIAEHTWNTCDKIQLYYSFHYMKHAELMDFISAGT